MGKDIILYFWAIALLILSIGFLFIIARIMYKAMKDPEMKLYKRFKWHIKEFGLMLSHKPSHYSSKRVERMIIFLNANIGLDCGLYYLLYKDKIGASELVLIYTAQMIYAGYQTKQIFKDTQSQPLNGQTGGN